MLAFQTNFNIDAITRTQFISEIKLWIGRSPNFGLARCVDQLSEDNPKIEFENESLELVIPDTSGIGIGARVTVNEESGNGRRWSTSVIVNGKESNNHISARVEMETAHFSKSIPRAKRPYIIKNIISRAYNANDSGLKLTTKPHVFMDEKRETILAASRFLTSGAEFNFPVIYVSCKDNDTYHIDCPRLASATAGIAHVVMEPTRAFSFKLMEECGGKNVYGGAVGVYWPNARAHTVFLPTMYDSDELGRIIYNSIWNYMLHKKMEENLTWEFLRERAFRNRIDALEKSGTGVVDEYIREFDKEIIEKNKKISELEKTIETISNSDESVESEAPIYLKISDEYYKYESLAFVVRSLNRNLSTIDGESREYQVLSEIVETNKKYIQILKEKRDAIKSCLSSYSKMKTDTRRTLHQLGFTIDESGAHPKILFHDNPRYQFTMSKTPSDHRSGKNLVSQINSKLF